MTGGVHTNTNTNTHHGSTIAWTPTASSPRRTTSLDGAPFTTSSAPVVAAAAAIYDKQLLWKQHGQKKVDHMTLERLSQEDLECTFAPKINRTSSHTRKTAVAHSSGSTVAPSSRNFVSDGGESDCSSSQYSAVSPRTLRSVDSADLRGGREHGRYHTNDECEDDALPLHPTESQESSILLHLARQERARDEAQRAQHKLSSTQPRKDFTKVTAARPFELSVTNRTSRRSTSASPTQRAARSRSRKGSSITSASAKIISGCSCSETNGSSNSSGPQPLVKRRSQGAPDDSAGGGGGGGVNSGVPSLEEETLAVHTDAMTIQWEQERGTLLSIIETQRLELERRERAQDDATRLAETFATAVEAFAQRLEIVERTTVSELSEMKQLLTKQTAATDLLLHALGLSRAPTPSAASSPLTSSSSLRRETK